MSWTPTDQQVEKMTIALHDMACPERTCEPQTMGTYRRDARAVLVAVGPMIAAHGWDEASEWVADPHVARGLRQANPYRQEAG